MAILCLHFVDAEEPQFPDCPAMIFLVLPTGEDTVNHTLVPPNATDNIAVDTVELKSGAMYDNKPLSRGMYTVIYEAFDTSGNVANCTFTLVVQGKYSSR